MSNIAIGVTFSSAERERLAQQQQQLLAQQGLFAASASILYLNIASWQLPSKEQSEGLLAALADVQQMTLSVYPIIDLQNEVPEACLQVVNTHILTNWHFEIHKRFELPYLGLNEQDMPKRWRPLIRLGPAGSVAALQAMDWPHQLQACEALLIDLDADEIIARQQLPGNDAIIW